MSLRGDRLKIAFVLAGRGSPVWFAKDCNSDRHTINAVSRGQRLTSGRVKKSSRLEMLIDLFIAEQFEKHKDILNIEGGLNGINKGSV